MIVYTKSEYASTDAGDVGDDENAVVGDVVNPITPHWPTDSTTLAITAGPKAAANRTTMGRASLMPHNMWMWMKEASL